MLILVGLGNPGDEYSQNRHNVGFMFADYIAKTLLLSREVVQSKYDKYLLSEIIKGDLMIKNNKINATIAKPQTFMNRSGDAVKKILTTQNQSTAQLIVVHDDLDIRVGNFKIQKGVGPKMHNGISSIEEVLGTADFWRIRIGVDNRDDEHRIAGETYVLQDFSLEENQIIHKMFPAILQRFHEIHLEIF